MFVSVVVLEKLPGRKGVTKTTKKEEEREEKGKKKRKDKERWWGEDEEEEQEEDEDDEIENMNFGAFSTYLVKITRHDYLQLFKCLYVHFVEYSTLILIFDPFCFSLFHKGVAKFKP